MADGGNRPGPEAHLAGNLLLVAETAGIYALDPDDVAEVAARLNAGLPVLADLGLDTDAPLPVITPGPVRALALTVSQACNMACTYCYAAGGSFGGPETRMTEATAFAAIDRLIGDAPPGGAVKIAFMGGEPMLARPLILASVRYAREHAAARAVQVGFSITTNGTLLTEADADFLAEQGFTVTVSLDGGRETNDRLRPMRGGAGSFERLANRLAPLLARADRIPLTARVTVTPKNINIRQVVGDLSSLGFSSVGVSPMLTSPTGDGALKSSDFSTLLDEMIATGEDWLAATEAQQPHAFSNLATAVQELHRGKARSHGCGAARDYLAVDASGRYSACHRFVNDPLGAMGDLDNGIDHAGRARFLAERRVEAQSDCARCWARKLCGGGCHQEVLHVGRPACDYVRGWLDFALHAYGRLLVSRPDLFDA